MAGKKKRRSVTRQVKDIQKKFRKTTGKISDKQEKVVTQILILMQSAAAYYTPQDTNALINSQYRKIISRAKTGVVGRVGYTQFYAQAIHDRTDWKPKPPGTPGKKAGGYNPNAEPLFLVNGYVDEKDNIKRIIKEENRL